MIKNLRLAFALIFLLSGISSTIVAQTKKGFNFQGYARNAEGAPLASQSVNVKFTIYPNGQPGSPDFEETQVTTTDAYGVFQLTVGAVSTAPFQAINFADKNYWIKVEVKTASSDFVEIANTELLAVPYARAADNGVPAGTILPFAGPKSKIPAGYLACDGTLYNNTDYPVLSSTIGSGWGGTGSQFRVPDLRGMFLRGVSESATRDEDKASRTASNAGGNSGNDVGSIQTEGLASHSHGASSSTNGAHTHNWNYGTEQDDDGTGGSHNEFTLTGGPTGSVMTSAGDHSHTITVNNTGGSETRPDNAYVYFIIKY